MRTWFLTLSLLVGLAAAQSPSDDTLVIAVLERQHCSDAILDQQHDPVTHPTHALGQEGLIDRNKL